MLMMNKRSNSAARQSRAGFTLIELTIVMMVAGLLLVPLVRMAGSAVIDNREKKTLLALEKASDALISFAALNGGCLPFASDFEGGKPDTSLAGVYTNGADTGDRSSNQNAGDLPWADLGLTSDFLDGDGLRIQYFVASPYTDKDSNKVLILCDAGFKGFQWDSSVEYIASSSDPLWIYDFDPNSGVRTLYEIKSGFTLDAGIHPFDAGAATNQSIEQLPSPLLEVRRGPDVTGAAPESDIISVQNVFILIAPGKHRNTDNNLLFGRDTTHTESGGTTWNLGASSIDSRIFSLETNTGASDPTEDGDDTMFIMSFNRFKAEMAKHGMNMESVCLGPC